MLAAKNDGSVTSIHIKKYGINKFPGGQKVLIEIAKLAAQENGLGISEFIQNYGIDTSTSEGQKGLIEIAKLAAQESGLGTSNILNSMGLRNFLKGQQALIEIAKLAAQESGWGTSQYIHEYGINTSTPEGQKVLIEIAKLALGRWRMVQPNTLKTMA